MKFTVSSICVKLIKMYFESVTSGNSTSLVFGAFVSTVMFLLVSEMPLLPARSEVITLNS